MGGRPDSDTGKVAEQVGAARQPHVALPKIQRRDVSTESHPATAVGGTLGPGAQEGPAHRHHRESWGHKSSLKVPVARTSEHVAECRQLTTGHRAQPLQFCRPGRPNAGISNGLAFSTRHAGATLHSFLSSCWVPDGVRATRTQHHKPGGSHPQQRTVLGPKVRGRCPPGRPLPRRLGRTCLSLPVTF